MSERPLPGRTYQHFKGNLYRVVLIESDTVTLEERVCYCLAETSGPEDLPPKYWSRPLSLWNEEVKFNGNKVKRFTLLKFHSRSEGRRVHAQLGLDLPTLD